MSPAKGESGPPDVGELTEKEMEVVTTVFRSYETGLREATIYPKVRTIYKGRTVGKSAAVVKSSWYYITCLQYIPIGSIPY